MPPGPHVQYALGTRTSLGRWVVPRTVATQAPPFGQPLHTVSELPYNDYGRYTPTVLAARDSWREGQLYVLLYLHPDNLGLEQTSLYRVNPG